MLTPALLLVLSLGFALLRASWGDAPLATWTMHVAASPASAWRALLPVASLGGASSRHLALSSMNMPTARSSEPPQCSSSLSASTCPANSAGSIPVIIAKSSAASVTTSRRRGDPPAPSPPSEA